MTIDKVERVAGTARTKYAKGGHYEVSWKVFFHDGWSEAALRLNTDGRLPKTGWTLGAESSPVTTDSNVYADQIDISLEPASPYASDAHGVALYRVTYEQITANFNPNPLDRIDITWGGAEDAETVHYDVDGNAVVNSAGQLYSPLPMRPIRGAECCITIRQLSNPAAIVALYSYSTNDSAMWGEVDPENGLIGKIQAQLVTENELHYWQVTVPIKFRRDSWRLKLIDNGYVFVNDDSEGQVATDDLGQQKPTPVLMNGVDGTPLGPLDDGVIYPGAAAGFDPEGYEINDRMNWDALSLPNPFTFSGS